MSVEDADLIRAPVLSSEDLLRIHDAQLQNSAIPRKYWESLLHKVQNEVFDAGDWFVIEKSLDASQDRGSWNDSDPKPVMSREQPSFRRSVSGDSHSVDIKDVSQSTTDGAEETESTTEEPVSDEEQTVDELFEEKPEEENLTAWRVVVNNNYGVSTTDPNQIFMIDHAWTYYANYAKKDLLERPDLMKRMSQLMNLAGSQFSHAERVDEIANRMWRYNHFYRVCKSNQTQISRPVWYIMDEFGSRIQHSDAPSFRIIPFYYIPTGVTYSVMWPIRDLSHGDEVTWDFISSSGRLIIDDTMRNILLIPWSLCLPKLAISDEDEDQELLAGEEVDTLLEKLGDLKLNGSIGDKLVVFTDVDEVQKSLARDDRFEVTADRAAAHVLWLKTRQSFNNITSEMKGQFMNHLPYEGLLTDKSLLSTVAARAAGGAAPQWLQPTYCLEKQLRQFIVKSFQSGQGTGLWIVKPSDPGFGSDCIVTDNLACILRQAVTAPKVVCEYITQPVLCDLPDSSSMVKFSLQYLVLLKSVSPLKLFIHDNFALKLANKSYTNGDFDDEEIHLTRFVAPSSKITTDFFESSFEELYLGIKWSNMKKEIYSSIHEVFQVVTASPPPYGLGHLPAGRTVFGVEIMLKWCTNEKGFSLMQPVVLSCESCPSFKPFISARPNVVSDVFQVLYMSPPPDLPVTEIA